MKSKADIIRTHLTGLRVLDIGGTGYEEDNPYERELREAWQVCKKRVCADVSSHADISVDLNRLPLPPLSETYDMATAFDVLEHLEHPSDVLRWIPSPRLIVTLPNALSPLTRRMERKFGAKHLYSFTPYTATILAAESGWRVLKYEYQFGKWSLRASILNAAGSLWPSRVGTGIILYCDRNEPTREWRLR